MRSLSTLWWRLNIRDAKKEGRIQFFCTVYLVKTFLPKNRMLYMAKNVWARKTGPKNWPQEVLILPGIGGEEVLILPDIGGEEVLIFLVVLQLQKRRRKNETKVWVNNAPNSFEHKKVRPLRPLPFPCYTSLGVREKNRFIQDLMHYHMGINHESGREIFFSLPLPSVW